MGRFIPPLISLMIFLVEYLLVFHILLSMAHGYSKAAPNVQLQQLKIINRRIGFELEQGGILPSIADAPSTPESSETAAEGPDYIRRMGKEHRHRHSSDKSVAGGGLIIGGLATAIFATVFCYIRVTRKSSSTTDHHMGSSCSSTMAVRGSTRTDGTTTSAASSSTK